MSDTVEVSIVLPAIEPEMGALVAKLAAQGWEMTGFTIRPLPQPVGTIVPVKETGLMVDSGSETRVFSGTSGDLRLRSNRRKRPRKAPRL